MTRRAGRTTSRPHEGPRRGARVGAAARIVVGLVLLVGVLFLAVFPTRTWLAQREAIAETRERLGVLRDENDRLRDAAERLQTPEEIERIAREHYSLAFPGEEVYAVIPAPPGTATARGAEFDLEAVFRLWFHVDDSRG